MAGDGDGRELKSLVRQVAATVLVGVPLALAVNAASARSAWPRGTGWIQRYPWQTIAGLVILIVVLEVVFWRRKGPQSFEAAAPAPVIGVAESSNGDAVGTGSIQKTASTNIERMHVDRISFSSGKGVDRVPTVDAFRVLLILVPQIDRASDWEKVVGQAIDEIEHEGVLIQLDHLTGPSIASGKFDAVVFVYGAGQHSISSSKVAGIAEKCRVVSSNSRLLFGACGLSNPALTPKEICEVLDDRQISQPWHADVFQDRADFQDWLVRQLRNEVRLVERRGRQIRSSRAIRQADGDFTEGDTQWRSLN